jgi:hypothetical protein
MKKEKEKRKRKKKIYILFYNKSIKQIQSTHQISVVK